MSEKKEDQSQCGELSLEDVHSFDASFSSSDKNELAMNALSGATLTSVAVNRAKLSQSKLPHFSVRLSREGKSTSQKSSGRCWLFAALNVIRVRVMKKYNLDNEFELSQPFMFFFDKLEKANFLLQNILNTLHLPDGSRVLDYLLQSPVNDGGQYDMFVNIVEKYGVVPKSVYPETVASGSSRLMNWIVTRKLREFASLLRAGSKLDKSMDELQVLKRKQMEEIYRILCIFLGRPPVKFDWTFHDKDKKFFRFDALTPKLFLEKHVDFDVGSQVSLINDPRNPYGKLYTVDYLGNVVGGKPVLYVNLPIDDLKRFARKTLESDRPVWFGCDVGKFFHRGTGVMDLEAYCYENMFDTELHKFTKAQRLVYGDSLMTHAMVFTGVDVVGDATRKWRVENSWGDKNGDKGYLVMTDEWFSEYLYQIVVDRSDLPDEVAAILQQEPTCLPAWDPMGALAE